MTKFATAHHFARPLLLAMTTLALLLSTLLPPSAARAAAPDDEAPAAIERAMDAVVAISASPTGDPGERGGGAGFFFDYRGLILTNAHVVGDAEQVWVTLRSGRQFRGEVIGRDGRTDLAVVRIDLPRDRAFDIIELKAPDKPKLGSRVYALGHPMGRQFSVSAGIISGFDRSYDIAWPVRFIQHDAALNPGNSGGPLIDSTGRLIGINTATPPETIFDIGIGLAIPIDLAATIAAELVEKGAIERGRLGISGSSADAAIAAALGNGGRTGLLVDQVEAESGAARAGLRPGDLLLSIDGAPLAFARDVSLALLSSKAGQTVTVAFMRNGKTLSAEVVLDRDEPEAGQRERAGTLLSDGGAGDDATPDIGLDLAEGGNGAIRIAGVTDRSLAQIYGLFEGDELIAVNGVEVATPTDARRLIEAAKGDVMVLRLKRRGQPGFHVALPLTPAAREAMRPGLASRLPNGPL